MNNNKHLVALVLSIGISLWLILMGVNIIFQEFPISDQLSTLLSTALGATVGALAVYMGEKDYHGPEAGPAPEQKPEPEPEPPARENL
jgi:hypothetical protein